MSRVRVLVLRGGPSDEFDVSIRTGFSVLNALDDTLFEPIDVIVTKAGTWLHDGRERYPEHLLHACDVVFNALHGTYGEDGTVQRLLDRFGIPYTGSGAYASSIAMHKGFTKEHLRGTSILLPRHTLVRRDEHMHIGARASQIRDAFGPHYVIKPARSGSSLGVSLIRNGVNLSRAIESLLAHHDEVMVEEYIEGKEVTCGVVERFRNHALYALPPVLIVPPPEASFFDEKVKYDGTTQELCPAPLSHDDKAIIEKAALHVHETLGLSQYSRSDFILSPHGLYFLEVNTLPGLTTESLFPKALRAVGASQSIFINHLVHDALAQRRTRVVPYVHV